MPGRLINGVPADLFGTWCPHDKRVMVPDPSDTSEHPALLIAEPWPCNEGCSAEKLAAAYEQYPWGEV